MRASAAWSSQDPEVVAACYEETASLTINHGAPATGRVELAATAAGCMEAFPDLQVTIDQLHVAGGSAFWVSTLTGTNNGPGGTGNAVRVSGIEVWKIDASGLVAVFVPDPTIEAAVDARFPRRGHRPRECRWSDYHVKKALANVLAPLPHTHPLWADLNQALNSERRWDAFVAAVEPEHRTGTPLPAAPRWFSQYGPRIRQQTIGRVSQQSHSTGTVEAVNRWLKDTLSQRARHLGNRRRAIKLLDLLIELALALS